jgi:hypothetical protein
MEGLLGRGFLREVEVFFHADGGLVVFLAFHHHRVLDGDVIICCFLPFLFIQAQLLLPAAVVEVVVTHSAFLLTALHLPPIAVVFRVAIRHIPHVLLRFTPVFILLVLILLVVLLLDVDGVMSSAFF